MYLSRFCSRSYPDESGRGGVVTHAGLERVPGGKKTAASAVVFKKVKKLIDQRRRNKTSNSSSAFMHVSDWSKAACGLRRSIENRDFRVYLRFSPVIFCVKSLMHHDFCLPPYPEKIFIPMHSVLSCC